MGDIIPATPIPEGTGILSVQRAGRAERDKLITHLHAMYATEHLSDEEYSARLTAAGAAKTVTQLHALMADLPGYPEPAPPQCSWLRRRLQYYREYESVPLVIACTGVAISFCIAVAVVPGHLVGGFTTGAPGPAVAVAVITMILGVCSAIVSFALGVMWAIMIAER